VTSEAADVESVMRGLVAEMRAFAPPAPSEEGRNQVGEEPHSWWTMPRKVWAFTVGLATIIGAVAAVLALVSR